MSASTGSRGDRARYLFEAYFHQDCLVDDPSWQAVVARFRDDHDPGTVRQTREGLLELLETNDDRSLAGLVGEWSSFEPSAAGLTTRAWIESIVHILAGGEPRASPGEAVAYARREAAEIASQVLAGRLDYILGARQLVGLRFSVDVAEDDPDFLAFVAIDSETDALPFGRVRERWDGSALARLEPELARAREWARGFGEGAFRNVVARFSQVERRTPSRQTNPDAEHLAVKLLETLHLSVPERKTLPSAGIPFSTLVAAVSVRLEATSWFPKAIDPGKDFGEGARIERRGAELWVHEQHESGVGRFGPIQSRHVDSIREAVRRYIEANHGSPIDGVNIDWDA
jgi:hypothetical protein